MMEKVRFRRKAGLGTHRFKIGGAWVVVSGGETITCSPASIGERYLDQYDCLDALPVPAAEMIVEARVPEIIPNEAKGWFDVVNPDYPDRPLNETRLRKKSAEEFLASLLEK